MADEAGTVPSSTVDCALYRRGCRQPGRLPLHAALESASDAGDDDAFVWIGLYEPSSSDFEAVAEEFQLHPLAVEDAVHAHQRPKLERYGDVLFVVFKTVRYVDPIEVIEVGEVMLFVGRTFVVSVRHGAASALGGVRKSLEGQPELLRHGPSAVLHGVADRIVDDYALALDGLITDVEEVEEQVFSTPGSNHAERIYGLKREILAFLRAARPLAKPLEVLSNGRVEPVAPEILPYFRDVHDHLLRTMEQVESLNELLDGALQANTAGVTTRQNEDMRKITAWVAILAWVTMIAGIYGMNFEHMPELLWTFGYPAALALMIAGAAFLYVVFKRRSWL